MANTFRKWTDAEVKAMLNDYLDEEKVVLLCEDHKYVAGNKLPPTPNCPKCAHVFIRHMVAKWPPHKRQENLERLEEFVHFLVEHEEDLKEFKPHTPKLEYS